MSEDQDRSQRRRYPRIPSENTVLVTVREGEELDAFAKTNTMGLGGCGFVGEEPLGEGSIVELMISVRPEVVRSTARVVYEHERNDGRWDVGVQFLKLETDDRVILEDLLGTALAEADDPGAL